ncbi:5-carboxymethyl-2-hydroxymuconate semialdehyde dehydrogenase [Ktedonosporobacter rubrisoli]|uniref:5-carboxymethyl-2-hydroxymuconate semialdehyde dehydrogenase n=1 Tax=Ktedonosporobacter rubrisoli TaxID=2509675 RepID=A0A4P6JQP5_KTERU|nr:5-carboxymethyl-2-hydroxymuconate semialdehyde dehydrogenase [Ktedonosporobacter rubrisoli]QBD77086.1 5-carboxymethyl-2-hydroxymuconate semialdehyde dehydrogenase [Ktedonosporobacter rubrisoli]
MTTTSNTGEIFGEAGSFSHEPVFHYINGRFQAGQAGRSFETLNPATNQPLAQVAEGLTEDIELAVRAARKAFDEGSWPRLSTSERAQVLMRIAEAIEAHADEIAQLEVYDVGMPITQARSQAARTAENFRFYARVIQNLAGEAYQVGKRFLNYTLYKPVGVAGLIMPWNTPLMLSSWRIAPALAAGNTVVLKPAEWSPLSADLFAHLLDESGLPAGVFNVVHGFGESCGAALVAHPGVNLIAFTGETTTGKTIMASAAATLKRCSVELGGKSPVIVCADADFEQAVDAAVFGIFSLNGERCTAGSRLLIEEGIYHDFVEAVAKRTAAIRVGDPSDPQTELGPLIHPEHLARVQGYIAAGQQEGARLMVGGARPHGLTQGNYLQATLFADVKPGMRIFQEEIFGPVLVAMPFRDEAEAIKLANAVRYGLAAYVWTRDIGRAHRIGQDIEAGMVWLNSQNVRDLRTPFGGVKESGIGHEGGHYAFDFYCNLQTIHMALDRHAIPRFGVE